MKKYLLLSLLIMMFSFTGFTQTAEELFNQGIEHYNNEQYREAIKAFSAAIKTDKNHYKSLKFRGDSKQHQGHLEKALEDYKLAEKINSDDITIYISKSSVYISLGQYADAKRELTKAEKIDPNNASVIFNKGCIYYAQNKYRKALITFDKAIEKDPNKGNAYFLRGATKSALGKAQSSIDDYKQATEKGTTYKDADFHIALANYHQHKYEEAVTGFSKVIDIKGKYLKDAYFYRADAKYLLERKDEACKDYKKAAELGDEDSMEIVALSCNRKKKRPKRTIEIDL